MVLTSHFVDANWVLQKRVLSSMHVPPPWHGVDIVNANLQMFKKNEALKTKFIVSVDNAQYNDRCSKELKAIIARYHKLLLDGKFCFECVTYKIFLFKMVLEGWNSSVNLKQDRLRTFSQIIQLKFCGKKLIAPYLLVLHLTNVVSCNAVQKKCFNVDFFPIIFILALAIQSQHLLLPKSNSICKLFPD